MNVTKKGVKLTNVFKELGLSSGNMSRWKNGVTPSAVNLKKLSDYFGISVDDLLGNKVHLKDERLESEQDKEIKTKLNSLSEKDKELVLDLMNCVCCLLLF